MQITFLKPSFEIFIFGFIDQTLLTIKFGFRFNLTRKNPDDVLTCRTKDMLKFSGSDTPVGKLFK